VLIVVGDLVLVSFRAFAWLIYWANGLSEAKSVL